MEKQQNSEEINWLLGKITKFGNCEKFLDKDGFYNEYYREMSKKEKNKFRKNWSIIYLLINVRAFLIQKLK